jgi:hypothetical protein
VVQKCELKRRGVELEPGDGRLRWVAGKPRVEGNVSYVGHIVVTELKYSGTLSRGAVCLTRVVSIED